MPSYQKQREGEVIEEWERHFSLGQGVELMGLGMHHERRNA
jgi:hypothetical protein